MKMSDLLFVCLHLSPEKADIKTIPENVVFQIWLKLVCALHFEAPSYQVTMFVLGIIGI